MKNVSYAFGRKSSKQPYLLAVQLTNVISSKTHLKFYAMYQKSFSLDFVAESRLSLYLSLYIDVHFGKEKAASYCCLQIKKRLQNESLPPIFFFVMMLQYSCGLTKML